MCKRPGKWERERAREREKGKGKEDIYYYTGTLPAAAQSRKPGIQGGALAIFFCSFLKAKRVSVLCQKVDQHALKGKQEIQGGALAIFFLLFGVETSICTLPKCRPRFCAFVVAFRSFWWPV